MIDWYGGTSRILVPSGKSFDVELYHFNKACRIINALLAAASICIALTVSIGVAGAGSLRNRSFVRIGFHLTPTFSLTKEENKWASLAES